MDETSEETETPAEETRNDGPVTVRLSVPTKFGKELVEELVLKPHAGAMRDLTVTVGKDGSMVYNPFTLALIGLEMAGHTGGKTLASKMHPRDITSLSSAVLGFLA